MFNFRRKAIPASPATTVVEETVEPKPVMLASKNVSVRTVEFTEVFVPEGSSVEEKKILIAELIKMREETHDDRGKFFPIMVRPALTGGEIYFFSGTTSITGTGYNPLVYTDYEIRDVATAITYEDINSIDFNSFKQVRDSADILNEYI